MTSYHCILNDVLKTLHHVKSFAQNIWLSIKPLPAFAQQPSDQWNALNEQIKDQCHPTSYMYATKKHPDEENPSIFGDQPVSEYCQQPFNTLDHKKGIKPEPKEDTSEAEIEDQLTDEQRAALEKAYREEDIEQHRSSFKGFTQDQL